MLIRSLLTRKIRLLNQGKGSKETLASTPPLTETTPPTVTISAVP